MNRLDKIASLLQGYEVACDIGTDHGYVLRKAFDQNYIKEGIAVEIAEGPLKNAKENLKNYPVTFYLSDGFDKVSKDFDVGIISGMGVYTIIEILNKAPLRKYILQPNSKHEILRRYLSENNYVITDEHIVFDKFYYIIIEAEPGYEKLSEEDIFLGPKLKNKKEAKEYYVIEYNKLLDIVSKCDNKTKQKLEMHLTMLKKVNTWNWYLNI